MILVLTIIYFIVVALALVCVFFMMEEFIKNHLANRRTKNRTSKIHKLIHNIINSYSGNVVPLDYIVVKSGKSIHEIKSFLKNIRTDKFKYEEFKSIIIKTITDEKN